MYKYQINCSSEKQRSDIITVLMSLGFQWHGKPGNVEAINNEWSYGGYQSLLVEDTGSISGYRNPRKKDIYDEKTTVFDADNSNDYRNMVRAVADLSATLIRKVEVKLNNEYTATISSDGTVKVGCQTFTNEQITKFIEAFKQVTK